MMTMPSNKSACFWMVAVCLPLAFLVGCAEKLTWINEGEVGSAYRPAALGHGAESRQEFYERMRAVDPLYGEAASSVRGTVDGSGIHSVPPVRPTQTYAPGPLGGARQSTQAGGAITTTVGGRVDPRLQHPDHAPTWPEYRLRPGDRLKISIVGQRESERSITVRPDGRINYLYGIEVAVNGRTFQDVRAELEEALSEYYRSPTVNVVGESFTGNTVFVMGPVRTPGGHEINADTRILDLMAKAGALSLIPEPEREYAAIHHQYGHHRHYGGFARTIDLEGAYIARGDRVLDVDFKKLVEERDMQYNIHLQPGDFIYFPSIYDRNKKIYLCGDVANPQIYYYSGTTSLLDMLLITGGVNERTARQRSVYVIRKGLPQPIQVDFFKMQQGQVLDVPLEDRDIVFVPERELSRRSRDTVQVIQEVIAPMRALLQLHREVHRYRDYDWLMKEKLDSGGGGGNLNW